MWTNFYPRPPRGGRPAQSSVFESSQEQFLSTPSARRATSAFNGSNNHIRFLSTPSARRATDELPLLDRSPSDFYPRPPRGGRLLPHEPFGQRLKFLSTPSARRATVQQANGGLCSNNFYPRPPRGGRPEQRQKQPRNRQHFYPRPPRGGRPAKDTLP